MVALKSKMERHWQNINKTEKNKRNMKASLIIKLSLNKVVKLNALNTVPKMLSYFLI